MRHIFLFLFSCNFLLANPENPTVIHGDICFSGLGSETVTVKPSDRAIINWESFSIQELELTQFIQSSEDSVVLNRIAGNDLSAIKGSLESNGCVYLINPNGIIFGSNSVVDVAAIVASTFDISNEEFINEFDLSFQGENVDALVNKGSIRAEHGDVVLISHRIENEGTLKGDKVMLGAGHQVLLSVEGKKHLYVRPDVSGDGIYIQGCIQAVHVMLNAYSSPFQLGIQNAGLVDALKVEEANGDVYLKVKGAGFYNDGLIHAHDGEVFCDMEGAEMQNRGLIEANGGEIKVMGM